MSNEVKDVDFKEEQEIQKPLEVEVFELRQAVYKAIQDCRVPATVTRMAMELIMLELKALEEKTYNEAVSNHYKAVEESNQPK